MGMKKDLHLLMASAAMSMLGCEYPVSHHVPKKLSKGESKKCKSFKYFERCQSYKNVSPMQIACNQHERRKKK